MKKLNPTSGRSYGIQYDNRYKFKNKIINIEPEVTGNCNIDVTDIVNVNGDLYLYINYNDIDEMKIRIYSNLPYNTGIIPVSGLHIVNKNSYDYDSLNSIETKGYFNDEELCNEQIITVYPYVDGNFNATGVYNLNTIFNYNNLCVTSLTHTYQLLAESREGLYVSGSAMTVLVSSEYLIGNNMTFKLYCDNNLNAIGKLTVSGEEVVTGNMLTLSNTGASCKSGVRLVYPVLEYTGDTLLSGITFNTTWSGLQGGEYFESNDEFTINVSGTEYINKGTWTDPTNVFFSMKLPDPSCDLTGT